MEDEEYRIELGKKITELREKQRERKADFAKKCEIDRTTLYRIELGTHDTGICTLRRIAKVLSIPIGDLVTI
jgi:DNA-binding XRE family transcriptional regulator